MRIQDQPAFILHHFPYRDSSQIIELFTRDYGRISVISRGSRGAKSKLKSILQAFRPLHVAWSGKGDLAYLNRAEEAHVSIPLLTGDALPCAFYVNEILMRLLHKHDVHENVFELYQNILVSLSSQHQLDIQLRLFEKEILLDLGFALNLETDANTGLPLNPDAQYFYYVEHGPVQIQEGDNTEHLKLSGKSLLAFARSDLQLLHVRREIKSLMRIVVAYYLGNKPLKSRELFR